MEGKIFNDFFIFMFLSNDAGYNTNTLFSFTITVKCYHNLGKLISLLQGVTKICVYKNGCSSLQEPRINLGGVCFLVQIDWINRKRDKTDSSFLKERCFDHHKSLDFHHHKTIKNLVKNKRILSDKHCIMVGHQFTPEHYELL